RSAVPSVPGCVCRTGSRGACGVLRVRLRPGRAARITVTPRRRTVTSFFRRHLHVMALYCGAMTSYVVLLRGVNVGGVTIRMADLRQQLHSGGFPGARTVLASGNVLLESDLPAGEVDEQCRNLLREAY